MDILNSAIRGSKLTQHNNTPAVDTMTLHADSRLGITFITFNQCN